MTLRDTISTGQGNVQRHWRSCPVKLNTSVLPKEESESGRCGDLHHVTVAMLDPNIRKTVLVDNVAPLPYCKVLNWKS